MFPGEWKQHVALTCLCVLYSGVFGLAQVWFDSFLMTHFHLSQVVPQRQQSSLPLPLHLVEREEYAGCAEKGKSQVAGVVQQAAVRLAPNSKPFFLCLIQVFMYFLYTLALNEGLTKRWESVFVITPLTHRGTFSSWLPHPKVPWLQKQSHWNPSKLVFTGLFCKSLCRKKTQANENQK